MCVCVEGLEGCGCGWCSAHLMPKPNPLSSHAMPCPTHTNL